MSPELPRLKVANACFIHRGIRSIYGIYKATYADELSCPQNEKDLLHLSITITLNM